MSPIRIGFAAELTGTHQQSAIDLREGVVLAVEEINAAGGINGRPIELVIEDDLGTPEGAKTAANNLIDAGVIAIIGNLTSNQTVAGYEVAEKRSVLYFSAMGSTSLLSKKNDLFFRTTPSVDTFGEIMAHYIFEKRGFSSVGVIYDTDNNTYAEPMIKAFDTVFESLGGHVTGQFKFSEATRPDFFPLINDLQASKPEAVFIIASSTSTASIAQQIYIQNWPVALFTAPAAQGQILITQGGKAVEGMEMVTLYDTEDPNDALQSFKSNFEKRFADQPLPTAMSGYETMQMLAAALKKTNGAANGLPAALGEIRNFNGLINLIHLDEYGDAVRTLYIQRVKNQKFVTVMTINPGQ